MVSLGGLRKICPFSCHAWFNSGYKLGPQNLAATIRLYVEADFDTANCHAFINFNVLRKPNPPQGVYADVNDGHHKEVKVFQAWRQRPDSPGGYRLRHIQLHLVLQLRQAWQAQSSFVWNTLWRPSQRGGDPRTPARSTGRGPKNPSPRVQGGPRTPRADEQERRSLGSSAPHSTSVVECGLCGASPRSGAWAALRYAGTACGTPEPHRVLKVPEIRSVGCSQHRHRLRDPRA